MRTLCAALFVACCLAACGGHPLAGTWKQDTGGGAPGMTLSFEDGGSRLEVHTAPDASGHHEHEHGTYTFAADSGAVTVECELLGPGKPKAWTGALHGERLELGAADTRLVFTKGGDPHGH